VIYKLRKIFGHKYFKILKVLKYSPKGGTDTCRHRTKFVEVHYTPVTLNIETEGRRRIFVLILLFRALYGVFCTCFELKQAKVLLLWAETVHAFIIAYLCLLFRMLFYLCWCCKFIGREMSLFIYCVRLVGYGSDRIDLKVLIINSIIYVGVLYSL